MTQIRHTARTHVGRVRKINEDAVLSLPDQNIFLVADGMGGHEAGDFASQTVVEQVAAMAPDLAPAERMQALRAALEAAHTAILAEAARRGGATVGAAVVSLILSERHFAAFWAGDSRLYRFRDGGIELLTTDHSVVAEFVKNGRMSWDEAEQHPQSNAITRAIGVGDVPGLEKIHGEVRTGDRFLLCSDGLNKYAGFETLRRAVVGTPIETVGDKLLKIALDGGGQDNISLVVVDVV
ncbi:PP2C family protein-serine/threonine phosphatase [Oceaniglobus roseus]|uniref:PP2C family protein-serine/threonine phosphatase n=1 Tax=Oceaniglobus roseus TaxID=1737570 RepID=UPI000C7F500C|nr:protein phosphatase 2C domain-containing protein [Kandeliimicrobium roseum]